MVNNFIFIEDGSLDSENLNRLVKNSENTNVKFITYRQCDAKSELVSIANDEQNINKITEEVTNATMDYVLEELKDFLLHKTERSVRGEHDTETMNTELFYKTIYRGSVDDFMKNFKEFLNNKG